MAPNQQDPVARAVALEAEIAELQSVLGANENADKIVDEHIKRLHRYNEAKDVTQLLIGKLASIRQITVKELHEDFGLTPDD